MPKAVAMASKMPLRNTYGFRLVMTKYSSGRSTPPWMVNPNSTVRKYSPTLVISTPKSSIPTILPAIRKVIPIGEYLQGWWRHRNKNDAMFKKDTITITFPFLFKQTYKIIERYTMNFFFSLSLYSSEYSFVYQSWTISYNSL